MLLARVSDLISSAESESEKAIRLARVFRVLKEPLEGENKVTLCERHVSLGVMK